MPKRDFNFIRIALRHGCSAVNFLHIFRTPFLKNTSGRLLLTIVNVFSSFVPNKIITIVDRGPLWMADFSKLKNAIEKKHSKIIRIVPT